MGKEGLYLYQKKKKIIDSLLEQLILTIFRFC